jgi:ABC-type uncharacterized transport system ATPase subunit
MEEAEELCQRVVFLSHGQTLLDAPMAQAKRKHGNLERLFTRLSGEQLHD